MKRYVQRFVETELGKAILKDEIAEDDDVEIYVDNNKLTFRKK